MAFWDGWFGSGMKTPMTPPTKEQGRSGTSITGGFVNISEYDRNPKAQGMRRYETMYDILVNATVVAAGVRQFQTLVTMPKWSVESVDDSVEAKDAAAFVESCMEDMTDPWKRLVRRSSAYKFYGFGIHEWTAKKRPDGKIGMASVEVRPVHTIERWNTDESGKVLGVYQRPPDTMAEVPINRGKMIYLVDDSLSDSPEGLGLWRHLIDPWDRMKEYLRLEGIGFDRDFRGIPVARAPLADLRAMVDAGDMTEADFAKYIQGIKDFITTETKSSKTAALLDSSAYMSTTADGETVSTQNKWDIELLTAQATGLSDIGNAIERVRYECLMVLQMEHLLLGSTESGSRALSEDKSRNLANNINSTVSDLTAAFSSDYITPLWNLNAFDPKLKPRFKAEDANFKDVLNMTQAMANLAQAGAPMLPGDQAVNDFRALMGVTAASLDELTRLDEDRRESGETPPTKGAPV